MTRITTIGVDLAKKVFQIHGVDAEGRIVLPSLPTKLGVGGKDRSTHSLRLSVLTPPRHRAVLADYCFSRARFFQIAQARAKSLGALARAAASSAEMYLIGPPRPIAIVCKRAFASVKTAYLTAVWTSGPATTLPWPRIRATGRSPSFAARDLPRVGLRTSRAAASGLSTSRISHTGTPP